MSDDTTHSFGGTWTERKLIALDKYLRAYQTIFKRNAKARHYKTFYIDAFAGTGTRTVPTDQLTLQLQVEQSEFRRGSVRVALELQEKFDGYVFVERKKRFVQELHRLLAEDYRDLVHRCEIHRGEANVFLTDWSRRQNWRNTRAVAFLDPYGMNVEWPTIEAISRTGGIDLWVLLPVGISINRVLTKDGLPSPLWGKRLTAFFGTTTWVSEFYQRKTTGDLFEGFLERTEKVANFEQITDFYIKRLKTAYPYVTDQPLALLNSKNNPMFKLCFASHNAAGLNIARDIARKGN